MSGITHVKVGDIRLRGKETRLYMCQKCFTGTLHPKFFANFQDYDTVCPDCASSLADPGEERPLEWIKQRQWKTEVAAEAAKDRAERERLEQQRQEVEDERRYQEEGTKVCSQCKVEKKYREFHVRKYSSGKVGYQPICRLCKKERDKAEWADPIQSAKKTVKKNAWRMKRNSNGSK